MTDTNTIWDIISGTPWWVFVLFLYLMQVGYMATKPRTMHIKNLMMMPILFIMLSSVTIFTTMHLTLFNVLIWTGTLLLGSALGWLQFYRLKIKAIKNQKKLQMPGTWNLLLIILAVFVLKYYFGYQIALNPEAVMKGTYTTQLLLLYGLVTGLFIGRVIYSLRCIKVGPFAAST